MSMIFYGFRIPKELLHEDSTVIKSDVVRTDNINLYLLYGEWWGAIASSIKSNYRSVQLIQVHDFSAYGLVDKWFEDIGRFCQVNECAVNMSDLGWFMVD